MDAELDLPDRAPAGGLEAVDAADGTVVRMWGDVDASLRGQASLVMAHALRRSGALVVDASQVEFLDSSGLAFVLQLLRAGEEVGRRVALRDPPTLVLDLLDLLGLSGTIPLEFSGR